MTAMEIDVDIAIKKRKRSAQSVSAISERLQVVKWMKQ